MNREYVPGITSLGTKHAKHDLSLDYIHRPSDITLEQRVPPNIIVRFNTDPKTEPLRRFLVEASTSVIVLWQVVSRLGIPNTPMSAKLPCYRAAMAQPKAVVKLDPRQEAVMKARKSGSIFRGPRYPHCHHRYRMRPPGFKTVMGANLLLFWYLFTGDM